MSRIGKLPVEIPQGVQVKFKDDEFYVKGPKGVELSRKIPRDVTLAIDKDAILVRPANNSRRARAMHGLIRTLINNMVTGVTIGFTKELEVVGVGYRVELQGDYLQFNLGYSHPILYELPPGVAATVERSSRIVLKGIDKEVLGQAAATIRSFRPPEPYKGKGIRYAGEVVRRKVGKAGA